MVQNTHNWQRYRAATQENSARKVAVSMALCCNTFHQKYQRCIVTQYLRHMPSIQYHRVPPARFVHFWLPAWMYIASLIFLFFVTLDFQSLHCQWNRLVRMFLFHKRLPCIVVFGTNQILFFKGRYVSSMYVTLHAEEWICRFLFWCCTSHVLRLSWQWIRSPCLSLFIVLFTFLFCPSSWW